MNIYCVYLTTYRGGKLPPFYIGYCLIKNIIDRNYHGSVSSREYKNLWKQELDEHPDLFTTKILCTFQTRKEANAREVYLQTKLNAVDNPLYINKGIWKSQISTKGMKLSKAHRIKLSKIRKGRKLSPKHHKAVVDGQRRPETRAKMSATLKGRKKTPEHIAKVAAANSKRIWSEESRRKMSNSKKGKKQSLEHREKIRQAALGKKRGPYKKKSIVKIPYIDEPYLVRIYDR